MTVGTGSAHLATYPDGEVVTYAYNAVKSASVKSNKQGKEETIVEKVG